VLRSSRGLGARGAQAHDPSTHLSSCAPRPCVRADGGLLSLPQRIMVIDGAMGTVIQQYKLEVRDAPYAERTAFMRASSAHRARPC